MKLTFCGAEYLCARAVKNHSAGTVTALDGTGNTVFSARNVTDFALFVLTGGAWEDAGLDEITQTQLALAELAETESQHDLENKLAIAELAETMLGGATNG